MINTLTFLWKSVLESLYSCVWKPSSIWVSLLVKLVAIILVIPFFDSGWYNMFQYVNTHRVWGAPTFQIVSAYELGGKVECEYDPNTIYTHMKFSKN